MILVIPMTPTTPHFSQSSPLFTLGNFQLENSYLEYFWTFADEFTENSLSASHDYRQQFWWGNFQLENSP